MVMPAAALKETLQAQTSGLPAAMRKSVMGPEIKNPAIPQLKKSVALKILKSVPRLSGGISCDASSQEEARMATSEKPMRKLAMHIQGND